jgi:PTS system ascorbate-specific IIB component
MAMGTPTIQCVCGFGCGTSLMLKMLVEDILKDQGLEAEVITGDIKLNVAVSVLKICK